MTAPGSLGDLIGAPVIAGTVRVGDVIGVYVDRAGGRAIGLEASSPGGSRRFLPWVAARFEGGVVLVGSPLVVLDDDGSYERRGAEVVRDRSVLATMSVLPGGEIVPAEPVSVRAASGITPR